MLFNGSVIVIFFFWALTDLLIDFDYDSFLIPLLLFFYLSLFFASLQVGLTGKASSLLKELNEIAKTTDTSSSKGWTHILTG